MVMAIRMVEKGQKRNMSIAFAAFNDIPCLYTPMCVWVLEKCIFQVVDSAHGTL